MSGQGGGMVWKQRREGSQYTPGYYSLSSSLPLTVLVNKPHKPKFVNPNIVNIKNPNVVHPNLGSPLCPEAQNLQI